jgi:pimeloyl-ACP methyl ester carboxylesterase
MEQTRHVTLGAGELAYQDSGAGTPLVFVHGIFANGRLWERVAPLLDPDYRCIVPDWPLGSHGSAMHPDADLTPKGLAALIVEFLDALDLDRAVLVGNDTGGALCQMVTAEYPSRVEALILTPCDAYENFPPRVLFAPLSFAARLPGGLLGLAEAMRLRVAWRLPVSLAGLAKHPLDRDLVDAWFGPARSDRAVRADAAKVIKSLSSRYTMAAAERLKQYPGRVLLAWSTEAPFFKFEYAERLRADLPNAVVLPISDAYTFVSLDQPQQTADAIRSFLSPAASQPQG